MKVIHKLAILPGLHHIDIPAHPVRILSCGVSHNEVCIWYERPVDPLSYQTLDMRDASFMKSSVEVLAVVTGEEFVLPPEFKFLGTVNFSGIIVHIYTKGFGC